jgi:hypothetical protein
MEYMDKVCAGSALGLTKATIEIRNKEGWKYKYEELLNCGTAFFMGGLISERVP